MFPVHPHYTFGPARSVQLSPFLHPSVQHIWSQIISYNKIYRLPLTLSAQGTSYAYEHPYTWTNHEHGVHYGQSTISIGSNNKWHIPSQHEGLATCDLSSQTVYIPQGYFPSTPVREMVFSCSPYIIITILSSLFCFVFFLRFDLIHRWG